MSYNIVRDYDWTSIPRGAELRTKAPFALVTSYKVKNNLLLNRLKSYIEVAGSGGGNSKQFYEGLYQDATSEEDKFYFPYFENSIRTMGNTWGDTFKNGYGGGDGIGSGLDAIGQKYVGAYGEIKSLMPSGIGDIIKNDNMGFKEKVSAIGSSLLKGSSPGSYIESPKFYDYASAQESPLAVKFILANTLNSDFQKNYKFVKKMIEINRPRRIDAIAMEPPRLFRFKLPGYRYVPWAYGSSVSINMLGTKRMIDGIIMPEAYDISIDFQPLTIEVSNFLEEAK